MTDKEFKRLSRAQLIDIIYQLQLQVDELEDRNASLEKALEDKRLRIENAGNIAQAALEINDCFRSAQNAAEQYLTEIKTMYAEIDVQRQKILDDARAEAAEIMANAQPAQCDHRAVLEEILKQRGQI